MGLHVGLGRAPFPPAVQSCWEWQGIKQSQLDGFENTEERLSGNSQYPLLLPKLPPPISVEGFGIRGQVAEETKGKSEFLRQRLLVFHGVSS